MGTKNVPSDQPVGQHANGVSADDISPDGPPTDGAFADQLLVLEQELISQRESGDVPSACAHAAPADARLNRAKAMLTRLIASGDEPKSLDCADNLGSLDSQWLDETMRGRSDAPRSIGRFQILRELGQGGAGVVLLAIDPVLKRRVALKLPRPEFLITPTMRRRFRREGEAVARLTHPHILTLYEVGEVGPIVFLCAAYAPGMSLAEWLRDHGTPTVRDAAQAITTLAEAMDYAHGSGVLHRDLKPANVLLEVPRHRDGARPLQFADYTLKIVDFGLAKLLDDASDVSRTGQVLGTPAYMAPEQATGGANRDSVTVDVYGLGAVFYELLGGRPPFKGDSYFDVLRHIVSDEPHVLPQERKIPADLAAICLKCLEKAPSRRYASADALAQDLRRWLRGEPVEAKPPGVLGKAIRWARRRPAAAALTLVSAFALLAITAIVVFYNVQLRHALLSAERQRSLANQRLAESELREVQLRHRQYEVDLKNAYREWQDGRVNAAQAIADLYLPVSGAEDLRTFEWYYLQQLLDDHGQVLAGHSGDVYHAEFSADGTRIVSAGKDGSVRLWDAETGELLQTFAGHTGEVNWVSLSVDGTTIASASDDGTLRLWDTAGNNSPRILARAGHPLRAACFTPDGKHLVAADHGGALSVYNCVDWQVVSQTAVENKEVHSLDVSLDSQRLVVGGLYHLSIFALPDVDRGPLQRLEVRIAPPAVSISPDLKLLAYCDGHRLDVVSLAQDDVRHSIFSSRNATESVCWAPDKRQFAAATSDGLIRIHGVDSPEPIRVLRGHSSRIWSVRYSPLGDRLVTADSDGSVRIWSTTATQGSQLLDRDGIPHLARLAFCHQSAQFLWNTDTRIKAYPVDDGSTHTHYSVATTKPWDALVTQGGKDIALWQSGRTEYLRCTGTKAETIVDYPYASPEDVRQEGPPLISPSGKLHFVRRTDAIAALYHMPDKQPVLETDFGPGAGSAFSRDERILVLWGERIRIFDTCTGRRLGECPGSDIVAILDARRELAVGRGNRIDILPLTALQESRLQIPIGRPSCLAATPDGASLAVGTAEGSIHLYSLSNGGETLVLPAHTELVAAIAFSADGRLLASVAGATHDGRRCQEVKLWPGSPLPRKSLVAGLAR